MGSAWILLLCLATVGAADLHVAIDGNDAADGATEKTAWRTLAKAADAVKPGDTVIVHPGVYFEHVQLHKSGTAGKPITFRASAGMLNETVISGAVEAIRQGDIAWKQEDREAALYSIPVDHLPARVLADEVNLFPYQSLDALKKLQVADNVPGPQHGFYYDKATAKLYVRLHIGGRYGSRAPKDHVMKISPVTGSGGNGRQVAGPDQYNFGVLSQGDAHVVLDGFTFETPGVAGVFSKGGHLTVRNCWFRGCRTAVSGRSDTAKEEERTNDVTIEYCDFTLFPAFEDMVEVVDLAQKQVAAGGVTPPPFYWWSSKNGPLTDELGLAIKVGSRWTIRGNRIHDVIDGLSTWGVSTARDLEVVGNHFDLVVDNAVETENFARRVLIHDNVIKDTFEPFSWQPMAGAPWPGPVWIYHNLIYDSPTTASLWPKLGWERGCFKIVCTDANWEVPTMSDVPEEIAIVPGEGFVVTRNTVWMPGGNLFSLGGLTKRQVRNFHFLNNIFVINNFVAERYVEVDLGGFNFVGNIIAQLGRGQSGIAKKVAGPQGRVLGSAKEVGFPSPEKENFNLSGDTSWDAGVSSGKAGFKILHVGPNVRKKSGQP